VKQLPPIVVLSLSLLHELRLGPRSHFYGYTQSLPRETVPLATLWDLHELYGEEGLEATRWLGGTAFEREAKRIRKEGHGRVRRLFHRVDGTNEAMAYNLRAIHRMTSFNTT
jgi:hypothetical protein